MEFTKIFSLSHWFTFNPASVGGVTGQFIFGFFAIVFVSGIIAGVMSQHRVEDRYQKILFNKVATMLITMGLLGVGLFFFSYEHVFFLGARFWYPVWLLGAIVWIVFIIRFFRKRIPVMVKRDLSRKEEKKYLPTRKQKRKKR